MTMTTSTNRRIIAAAPTLLAGMSHLLFHTRLVLLIFLIVMFPGCGAS